MKVQLLSTITLIFSVIFNTEVALAEDCAVDVELRNSKQVYFQGEPVELILSLKNRTQKEINIPIAYPDLGGNLSFSGLSLSPDPHQSQWGGRVPIIQIPTGGDWTVPVYLQRFGNVEGSGNFDLPFRLSMPCQNLGAHSIQGHVSFMIGKNPASTEEKAELARDIMAGLESSDYWRQRSAAEELILWDAPESLELTGTLMTLGFHELAIQKLTRLKDSPSAVETIINLLKKGTVLQQQDTLKIATAWKLKLDKDSLADLSKRGDRRLKLLVLDYVKVAGNKDYKPIIEALTKDAEEEVQKRAHTILSSFGPRSLGGPR